MKVTKIVMITTLIFSTTVFADEISWKTYNSKNLTCGDTIVHVESVCQTRSDNRICRHAKMFIQTTKDSMGLDNRRIDIPLPFVSSEQRKLLESQPNIVDGVRRHGNYRLDGVMQYGKWSPRILRCINIPKISKPLLEMRYELDNDSEFNENIKGSLSSHPVIIDDEGHFSNIVLGQMARERPEDFKIKGKGDGSEVGVNGAWVDQE
jgi:hypothetical protein